MSKPSSNLQNTPIIIRYNIAIRISKLSRQIQNKAKYVCTYPYVLCDTFKGSSIQQIHNIINIECGNDG